MAEATRTDRTRPNTLDALLPAEVARVAEDVGVRKAHMGVVNTLALAVAAGAFIAFGAIFATTVTTATGNTVSWGVGRLPGGLVFSLGLILVVVAGAELFTGNNLIMMAWMAGKLSVGRLLRNRALVDLGNLVGALGTAVLTWHSAQYAFAGGALGINAFNLATYKVGLGFPQAVTRGILCNALVCLAVWLAMAARTGTDKVIAVIFPITGFVAAGFEHCVANMYFIHMGLLIKTDTAFMAKVPGGASACAALTRNGFIVHNLLLVTLGNILGGGLVGLMYWFVYQYGESG
jgi:formate transporter